MELSQDLGTICMINKIIYNCLLNRNVSLLIQIEYDYLNIVCGHSNLWIIVL